MYQKYKCLHFKNKNFCKHEESKVNIEKIKKLFSNDQHLMVNCSVILKFIQKKIDKQSNKKHYGEQFAMETVCLLYS